MQSAIKENLANVTKKLQVSRKCFFRLPSFVHAFKGTTSCRREAATICPALVRAARCGPAPAHTRLAGGAQRALLPVAVGAMNTHDVRDRRQTDRRQTA